jgi:hypothetical protein
MCDLSDAFSGISLSDQQMKVTKGHDKLLGSLIGKPMKKKKDFKPQFTPMEKSDSESASSSSEEEDSPRKVKSRISKIEKEHAILSERLNTTHHKKRRRHEHKNGNGNGNGNSHSNSHSHLDIPASMVRSVSSDYQPAEPYVREPHAPLHANGEYSLPKGNNNNVFNQTIKRLLQGGLTTDRNVTTFVVIILMGLAALYIADKLFSLNG